MAPECPEPGAPPLTYPWTFPRGRFGQVLLLHHKQSGEVHAGKFYRGHTAKERAAARREMDLMNHLHHPKLVQYLAAYDTASEVVMVME